MPDSDPPGRPIVACDLDRTLIYSAAALQLAGPDSQAPALVVAEVLKGAPLSFMTRLAEDVLVALRSLAGFVPVTTRTVAQYQRIRLGPATPAYAITSNGGHILTHGEPDRAWSALMTAQLAERCSPLSEVYERLRTLGDPSWLLRTYEAENLFCYAVVDRAATPAAAVQNLAVWCAARGWTVSLQGRKLYCVPEPLSKSAALAEVRRRTGGGLLLAAGDSLLDADLLRMADVAFRPAHGELHEAGMTLPHLTITDATGVLAGQEILLRMHARLTRP